MPKFSIKDLMVATAFVAVGLGVMMYASTTKRYESKFYEIGLVSLCFIGPAIFGIGIAYPFRLARQIALATAIFLLIYVIGGIMVWVVL